MSHLQPFSIATKLLDFGTMKKDDGPFHGYYHCHQSGEWLLIHEGRGKVVVGGRMYELQRGMLFYFQPYQIHRIQVDADASHPYIRSVIHFDPYALENSLQLHPSLQSFYRTLWLQKLEEHAFDVSSKLEYLEEMYGLYRRLRQKGSGFDHVETDGLFAAQLLVFLKDQYEEYVPDQQLTRQRPLRYAERIMAWLETRYHQPFKLEALAQDLHLSKYYVSAIFREETGDSITHYLITRRMKEACILLNTTKLSIAEIGHKIGLNNTSYFCKLFKKTFGLSPNRYREE